MKQVIVITGSAPFECMSIRRMTKVKWSQSSGPGPRGMLRRDALKDRDFAGWSANQKLSGFHGGISPLKSASGK